MHQIDSIKATQALAHKLYKDNEHINITKLQKLLYIFYGFSLLMRGQRVLNERPRCFQYGPLFLESYSFLRNSFSSIQNERVSLDPIFDELAEAIINRYGKWTARQLVDWTHRKGSPWYITDQKTYKWGEEIDDELIVKEFEGILNYGC